MKTPEQWQDELAGETSVQAIREIQMDAIRRPQITDVAGKPISRAEVIEGLRVTYTELLRREREDDPTISGYPDMERILDYIEAHGLEPLNVPS